MSDYLWLFWLIGFLFYCPLDVDQLVFRFFFGGQLEGLVLSYYWFVSEVVRFAQDYGPVALRLLIRLPLVDPVSTCFVIIASCFCFYALNLSKFHSSVDELAKGQFCWHAAVDVSKLENARKAFFAKMATTRCPMTLDTLSSFPAYCEEQFLKSIGIQYGIDKTLRRVDYLVLTELFPSRAFLRGDIAVINGTTYVTCAFHRRSHRRIRFGRSTIDDSLYVHVDVQTVINVATAANASTMGLNEANQRFKTKTASTLRVNLNLTPKQEKELRELADGIPFDITGGRNNTSDHPVLAGGRILTREMFEALYRVKSSSIPSLVVGSAYNDLDTYEINSNIDHYFAGVESKDYLRTVVPLLERFAKRFNKNLNGSGSLIAKDTYRARLKTVRELLECVRVQEGWQMGLFTELDELERKYERLVFRDVYEVGPKQMEDLFNRTGANHAVGYGIYPDELVFDNVAPDKHYRYDHNPVNNRSTLTYRGGYSNGYSHNKDTWGWFLNNPVLDCVDYSLVTEIVSRVGPYAIYSITKVNGRPDYVPRTLGLPRHKHRALLMDAAAVFQGADPEKTRFAVNLDEWVSTVNWAMSLQQKALAHDVVVMYVRRMIGGVSLVNKELVTPWTLKPIDVPRFALAVLIHVMRTKGINDEVLDNAFGYAPKNLLLALAKKPVGILAGLARYIHQNGVSKNIAVYPDNEFFTLDSTPLIRADNSTKEYRTNLDVSVEHTIGCEFCREIAPKLGKQVVKCHNASATGLVDVSMTDDELRSIINELQDDDDKAAGLAKLFQDVKKYVPNKGFENTAKFSYILGGPGAGKSHLIRSIANDEDSIYVPFMKLRTDYEMVPDPVTGRPRDLKFATTHRGLKLGLCKRLFIDEFTALDWRYIKMVIRLTSPDEVFIVGDTKQTGIRTGVEGINIQDAVRPDGELAIVIDDLPRHQLMINFRNGRDTVHWMNKQCDYGFGSNRPLGEADSLIVKCVADVSNTSDWQLPSGAQEMFFTHNNAIRHGRSPNDSEKYTVRSFQGSTVDNAIVHLTKDCLPVASAHGMLLVALTRARERTYLVHDGSREVMDFLIANNLPITGPYCPDGPPIPEPVNEFVRELKVAEPAALDFARHVLADQSLDTPVVEKPWFELTSYQVLSLFVWAARLLGYKTSTTLVMSMAVVGFDLQWRKRNVFKCVSAFFLINTIGLMHQAAAAVVFVFRPHSYLYRLLSSYSAVVVDNEIQVVKALFGDFAEVVLQKLGLYVHFVREYALELLGRLPMAARLPFLNVPYQSLILDKLGMVSDFPSRIGITNSNFYLLVLTCWVLYYRKESRIVFRMLQSNQVSTASIGGSIFSTTMVLRFGDNVKASCMDYFVSNAEPLSKPLGTAYNLLSTTWMPGLITGISYIKEEDLEAQVPDGLRVTPCDSFRAADTVMGTTPFIDPDMVLTNAEQTLIPSDIRNGQINVDDFMVPLDNKRRLSIVRTFRRFCSGYGYHFSRDSMPQSVKAIATRYLNKKTPSKVPGPTAVSVATEIVDRAMKDMFVPLDEIHHSEFLMELAIQEASKKAVTSSYSTQVSEDAFDAHKVRMFMKETFKPGPLSSLKPFNADKAGMGVSPFDKSAHVTFSVCMRYINLLILDSLKSNVIYDNRLTEDQLQDKVNAALSEVPPTAVNGVTDFVKYDSQQDEMCQLITKSLFLRFGVSEEMLDHYYNFCSGSTILSDGGLKGRLEFEKLSGDPATLLTNSMLGGMITNYLFQGQGPFCMVIKGDDAFKRQLNLTLITANAIKLAESTRLQAIKCFEEPAEFCGKIVGTVMCDNIYRKMNSILSKNYSSYTHFMEAMESVRFWIKRQEKMRPEAYGEFIAQNAELLKNEEGPDYETGPMRMHSVFNSLDIVKSLTHLSKEDFEEMFEERENPRIVPNSSYSLDRDCRSPEVGVAPALNL
jgi:hypothetical protein